MSSSNTNDALAMLEELPFDREDLEEPMYCSKCGQETMQIYTCNSCHMTYMCPTCFVKHLRCENTFPQIAKKNMAIVSALSNTDLPKHIREILHDAL